MQPFLSIVVPAHNEAQRIGATLADIAHYLDASGMRAEVIVVNDGSADGTALVVESAIRGRDGWRQIQLPANRGKGGAVREGMQRARGEWILFMDADNSTALDQIEQMRPFMERGHDVIIGSRAVHGARLEPPQPWLKRSMGKLGNLLIRALVLPGVHDTQCGFKIFSARAIRVILPRLATDGWGFDVEMLALARQLGYQIAEVPVRWVNDRRSQVGVRGYLTTLRDVLMVRSRIKGNKMGAPSPAQGGDERNA